MSQVKDFVTSRLWKLVKQLATYLSGFDEWYPYDVSMNIIRNSHYPRIHEDCEPSEVLLYRLNKLTGLLYVNSPEGGGEDSHVKRGMEFLLSILGV